MEAPMSGNSETAWQRAGAIVVSLLALAAGFAWGTATLVLTAIGDPVPAPGDIHFDPFAQKATYVIVALLFWFLFTAPALGSVGALLWPLVKRTPRERRRNPWAVVRVMGLAYVAVILAYAGTAVVLSLRRG